MSKRRPSIEVARERAEKLELDLKAIQLRQRIDLTKRAYDAASTSNLHPRRGDARSGDAVMQHAGPRLREYARYLDENLDLAVGVLDVLTDRVVGRGIAIDPMVQTPAGTLHEDLNAQIARVFERWAEMPETTGELHFAEAQRLLARTWFRDGEILINHISGTGFPHAGPVPYTLELIESDFLPFDLSSLSGRPNRAAIIHGVEKNAQRQPVTYHLYREHPGNRHIGAMTDLSTVPVPADQITHLKLTSRIGQTRGVTIFHGVLQRLDDIKDYEESERVAARVAASFTAFIRKADSDISVSSDADGNREFELAPGMVWDGLLPGEEIGTIDPNRPNTALEAHRNSQMRAVAAGTSTSYSSVSKRYDGTYSAQRQELVESQPAYDKLRDCFVAKVMRRVYRDFVGLAVLSGQIDTTGADLATLFDAEFIPPAMPWIDPLKEMQADKLAIDTHVKSRPQVIRERGGDPRSVDRQIEMDPNQAEPAPAPTGDAPPGDEEMEESAA